MPVSSIQLKKLQRQVRNLRSENLRLKRQLRRNGRSGRTYARRTTARAKHIVKLGGLLAGSPEIADLVDEVSQIAKQEGKDSSDFIAEAVHLQIAIYRQKRIAAETDAWYGLSSDERDRFVGKYVAVYKSRVVDNDVNRLILLLRVRERYGRQPIPIIKGGAHPIPVYQIRSPRRAQGTNAN